MALSLLVACGARSALEIDAAASSASSSSAGGGGQTHEGGGGAGTGGDPQIERCPADLEYFIEVNGDGPPQRYPRAFVLNNPPAPGYPDSPYTNGPAAGQYAVGDLLEIGACVDTPDRESMRFAGSLGLCSACDGTSGEGPAFYYGRTGQYFFTYEQTTVSLVSFDAFKASYDNEGEVVVEGNYSANVDDGNGLGLTLSGEFRVCVIPSQPVF